MTLKTRTISAIAASAIALTAGITAVAGQTTEPRPAAAGRGHGFRPGGPGGRGGSLMALRRLNLTDEQREQVKAILKEARGTDGQGPGRQVMELRRSLSAAILAETPDQAQIDQLRAAIVQAEAAALAKRVEVEQKIAQILTPEQREQARQVRKR